MKRAQLIGFGIAGTAGLIAFFGMQGFVKQKPGKVTTVTLNTVDVLVARENLNLGDIAAPEKFAWKKWPKTALTKDHITRKSKPNAKQDFAGDIVSATIMKNDPITQAKLVQPGKGGVLSAILPKGKRAVSTKISDISAAGKLILPNDHVDVLFTKKTAGSNRTNKFVTETLFRNVRVLAIGKKINIEDKKNGADGPVATLELTPRQAEMLALANGSRGQISLSLRSIADVSAETPAEVIGVKTLDLWSRQSLMSN